MAGNAHKGRGTTTAVRQRFESRPVELTAEEAARSAEIAPETVLRPMHARSIISHNDSPDIPFSSSINPYLGCEHGCAYCYARPAHSYLDLSPGLDFETQIFYKPNAEERLLSAWEKPAYRCEPITIGANTDPYQPAERQLEITRRLLGLFLKHRHPVSIISKGITMSRDLDLLAELAARNLCSVAISLPTLDASLKRKLEPRVPAASARLRLIADLSAAGIPCSVLVAPVIPAVNDTEIESILEKSAAHGASRAAWILLRLPHEVRDIFRDWLETHMPDRAGHVFSLLRQAHAGREYDSTFGKRQTGGGAYAEMIGQRFRAACRRLGLTTGEASPPLDCSQFDPPGAQQLGLDLG